MGDGIRPRIEITETGGRARAGAALSSEMRKFYETRREAVLLDLKALDELLGRERTVLPKRSRAPGGR